MRPKKFVNTDKLLAPEVVISRDPLDVITEPAEVLSFQRGLRSEHLIEVYCHYYVATRLCQTIEDRAWAVGRKLQEGMVISMFTAGWVYTGVTRGRKLFVNHSGKTLVTEYLSAMHQQLAPHHITEIAGYPITTPAVSLIDSIRFCKVPPEGQIMEYRKLVNKYEITPLSIRQALKDIESPKRLSYALNLLRQYGFTVRP